MRTSLTSTAGVSFSSAFCNQLRSRLRHGNPSRDSAPAPSGWNDRRQRSTRFHVLLSLLLVCFRRVVEGQDDPELGVSRFAVHLDGAMVLGDKGLRNRQAETGAGAVGARGEQRIKMRSRMSSGMPVPLSMTGLPAPCGSDAWPERPGGRHANAG